MALLGTLKGFGVTEIFQLISQQMKTGSLILTSTKAKVTIAFEDGMIVGITSDIWALDPRADVLLKGGIISEKDLRVAQENKKSSQHWHEILISQGKLKSTFLDKSSIVVIRNIFLEIFQWKDGSYRFEDWETKTENMLTCHIQTESIILDTLRMIDEWPTIKQRIPPVDYCPVIIMPITEELVKKYDLSKVDMNIFDLIDENKTVEAIVRQSLETPFEALSSIVKLLDTGLIEVFPQGIKDKRDFSKAKRALYGHLKRVSTYLLLGLCILGLIIYGNPRIAKLYFIPPEIRSYIDNQKEMSKEFAKQGIKLSTLSKDSYDH